MLKSKEHAYELMDSLGASNRLLLHVTLVAEVAETLIEALTLLNVTFDKTLVQVGAIIHDAGKIIHTKELNEKGNKHEAAGEILMLENGASPKQARICLSHAQYETMSVTLEEQIVALSDKLWKGKRVEELELSIIDTVASNIGIDRWDIYSELDSTFESIAADGDIRLQKSKNA